MHVDITMPPQYQTCSAYSDLNGYQPLVYIPSPYSLTAGNCFQPAINQAQVGVKRKRDEYEDNFVSDAELCSTLLQTSVLKLQKTQTTTPRGRRRSPSLRRSVLIFNMVHSLQTDFAGTVQSSSWHSLIQKPAITVDSSVVDDKILVSDSASDDTEDKLSLCSAEAEPRCNNTLENDSFAAWQKNAEVVSEKLADDSVVQFDCGHCKMELNSITGEKTSIEMAFVPQLPCESQSPLPTDVTTQHATQYSVPQTQTFLSDEMVDFEASLFDFDCLDSDPCNTSVVGFSKEVSPHSICGYQLELLDDDIEYLMHILVDS